MATPEACIHIGLVTSSITERMTRRKDGWRRWCRGSAGSVPVLSKDKWSCWVADSLWWATPIYWIRITLADGSYTHRVRTQGERSEWWMMAILCFTQGDTGLSNISSHSQRPKKTPQAAARTNTWGTHLSFSKQTRKEKLAGLLTV